MRRMSPPTAIANLNLDKLQKKELGVFETLNDKRIIETFPKAWFTFPWFMPGINYTTDYALKVKNKAIFVSDQKIIPFFQMTDSYLVIYTIIRLNHAFLLKNKLHWVFIT